MKYDFAEIQRRMDASRVSRAKTTPYYTPLHRPSRREVKKATASHWLQKIKADLNQETNHENRV